MVPVELENHLQMNATKFDDYQMMRTEVVRYVEAKAGTKIKNPNILQHDKSRDLTDPMDLNSLAKEKGSSQVVALFAEK